jgi:molybdenum cofactor cytidylyltransferase
MDTRCVKKRRAFMTNPVNTRGSQIVIGILAAGSSKRLGQPKQLINAGGVSLLQRQVSVANETGHPVYVVLGEQPETQDMREQVSVPCLTNTEWASGMASSLKCLIESVPADAWLLLTVDQYRLDTPHLKTMIDHWQNSDSKTTIVATAYDSTLGVPALIPAHYKASLLRLSGDQGAGRLIRQLNLDDPDKIISIENPELSYDVDTVEDLTELEHYFKLP